MPRRLHSSLATLAIALGLINATVVLALGLVVMGVVYQRNLREFVQAPVRDRILAVSRKIALDLFENDSESWDQLLTREATGTPFTFVLLDSDGRQIAGKEGSIPPTVMDFARSGRAVLSYTPKYNQQDRPDRQYSKDNVLLQRDRGTKMYWAGVHVLIHYMDENMYGHGTLLWEFPNLWTNTYFFNLWPYVLLLGGSILLTVLCWLPPMGLLLRRVSRLTLATREIAQGNFEATLPAGRNDEVGQLTASIAMMSRQLSGLLLQQQRFVSDAAHELTSPVSRLRIAVELLQGDQHEAMPGDIESQSQRERYIADIAEEVEQIAELIQDLLYYSRARNSRLSLAFEDVHLATLIRTVITREDMSGGNVAVSVSEDLHLAAPPAHLRRAIANLLRNAQLYAGAFGTVEIAAFQKGEHIHVLVRDEGPGIPEAELDYVFAPFYRVEYARSRPIGGTGLGLAIVKSSVEVSGGTVLCRNRKPSGLEVEITLPVTQS